MLMVLIIYAIWRCGIPIYVDWDKFHEPGLKNFIGPETIYLELAESILKRGEYSQLPAGKPYGIRTPGYSIIIAGFLGLFGDNWAAAMAIFHAGCIIFAAVCAYIIGTQLRSPPVGAFAGFMVATYAPYHFITCGLLREPFCLALFALIILLLLERFYRKWTYIALGLLIGMTAMIREEFLLLVIPSVIAVFHGDFGSWKAICAGFNKKWRVPAMKCAAIIGLIMLVFSPWIIRNAIVYKRFQMTGTLGGIQLYLGNNPSVRSRGYVYDYGFIVNIPEMKTHNDYEVGIIYRNRALKFMLANPGRVIFNGIGKVIIAFENSVHNVNDFPVIIIGLVLGILVGAHFKLDKSVIMLISAGLILSCYIYWRGGFHLGLLLPNIEFGWGLRLLGLAGFGYMLYRREEPIISIVFPLLFLVNIVFIPQHRHRWITDWLFMLWIAIFLRDCALYVIRKQIDSSFNTIRKQM